MPVPAVLCPAESAGPEAGVDIEDVAEGGLRIIMPPRLGDHRDPIEEDRLLQMGGGAAARSSDSISSTTTPSST